MDRKVEEELQGVQTPQNEEQQDYYVDPLNQEAVLKQHQIELEKKAEKEAEEAKEQIEEQDEVIHPDMNVSGFFSAKKTNRKNGIMHHAASKGLVLFSMISGLISAAYAIIYLLLLFTNDFSVYWFMSWAYAASFALALISFLNCLRSLKSTDKASKKRAIISLPFDVVAFIPLLTLLIHYLLTTF